MQDQYDVIVVGAGPAGASAAIYTSRADLDTLLLDKGDNLLNKVDLLENYYGFPQGISGKELLKKGKQQAKKFGTEIINEQALSIEIEGQEYKVETAQEEYLAQGILLATGVQQKKPSVGGIEELEGKGVSYCVVCDAPLYRDQKTAVLGSKDYAAKEALKLNDFSGNVRVYTNGKEPRMRDSLKKELEKQDIEIETEEIKEVVGEEELKAIDFGDRKVELDGLFVAIGTSGTLDFARTLGLEINDGYIEVDEENYTGMPRIYAAGDCVGGERQVAIAVGEGAEAATNLIEDIKGQKYSDWSSI
ncbi:thioredoxin-disulfide reductase [archaeon SCG-AAA382B04]|nr:thioredoxin-disulfide reductase [archaeon SCG-AAA382B04]